MKIANTLEYHDDGTKERLDTEIEAIEAVLKNG